MFVLRLLGPLVLENSGRPLALPTNKAAAILAWLALEGPAPRSRIASALWPALDAASARRNLRRELARLREVGGADRLLVSEGERLLLHAGVALDTQQFSAEIAASRHDAALARWRGPVADGLSLPDAPAFEDLLAGARTRLARQRVAALEARAAALEAQGDGAGALRSIETLLAEDPLQEAHQRTAMRLHAAAGRRAAALAGYERFAALLAGELGLAPMADTVALVRTLRQADAPPVTPAPMAPGAPAQAGAPAAWQGPALLPFVGRDDELAVLEAAWQQGQALVIEGAGGIGKTRLASEFAGAHGAFALAACRSGDAAQPYAAFTRALRLLAGPALSHTVQGDDWPRWVRDELSQVLPELGPAAAPIGSASDRERFFEACAEAWALLSDGSFDAVIIDDWHLADTPSRALLAFIVRRRAAGRACPREVLLLRPGLAPAERAPIDALIAEGLATQLRLAPLSARAIGRLADQLAGVPAPPRLGERLVRASGGNPFAIDETLRHWAALSLWSAGADGRWALGNIETAGDAVPDDVRHTVLARAAGLPEAARRLLEAAALASEPFTPALLAGACALSEVQALNAIEAAMASHLLRERDGGFAFTHDLVQAALESQLPADRRRLVHRRLALGAEALRGLAALPAAEVARHWEAGGEPARAVPLRMAAGASALALFEDQLAEVQWAQALADGAPLAQRIEVAIELAKLARQRDDRVRIESALRELDALAEVAIGYADCVAAAIDARLNAAEIMSVTGRAADALARIDGLLEAVDAAVAAATPPPDAREPGFWVARRAYAWQVKSQAFNALERPAEALQAAATAINSGGLSPMRQGKTLHAMVYGHFLRNELVQAEGCAQRSLALWQSMGLRHLAARAHANLGLIASVRGDNAQARAQWGTTLAMAREMRIVGLTRQTLPNLAYLDLEEGQPQAALDKLDAAWHAAPGFAEPSRPVYIRGMQVHALAHLGRLGEALDMAEDGHRRAVGLQDGHALADCVSMSLDLLADVGAFEWADAMLASLPGGMAAVNEQWRIKLRINRAHLALARGRLDDAAQELDALGDIAALAQPYDRGYAALRWAELGLARADAGGAADALAWAERGHADATPIEARTLLHAARVRALRRLHGEHAAACVQAQAEAQALLAGPATVPALAALHLRRACAIEHPEQVLALATSLDGRPATRASFNAHWAAQALQR